jgi:capsid protein
MIANAHNTNGHANGSALSLIDRIVELDTAYFERRQDREAASTYTAGTSDRMNPVPKGVDPLGTDADYHYRTERNYFLMVERARAAVRNHPLVEQGVNRLIANMRIGDYTLDVNSGDPAVDADQKAFWHAWCGDPKECDYEQQRTFAQKARQSFFSQVVDGDILHLPLVEGSLQTWEAHHVRNPWGRYSTGSDTNGLVHGAEVVNGRIVAYWVTPRNLLFNQVARRGDAHRVPVFDTEGNKNAFWLGFTHRFFQRRGISRLSAPRDAMNGFDDLNYAHIKSALRRSVVAFLMRNTQPIAPQLPLGGAKIPQSGSRYTDTTSGLGLETQVIEQFGEPAQVLKAPAGYDLDGWNANIPTPAFFEHSALLLTMLAVNLDLPLMFLLLDGSLVNFHGGRMTFDQVKLRLDILISDQIAGLYNPTYQWKTRQRITPGSKQFDPALYAAVQRGANPFKFQFRAKGWPYVKPLEDAAAEDLAERRNLKSMKSILAARGVDEDDHIVEVVAGRGKFIRAAIREAQAIAQEFPEVVAQDEVPRLWRELRYGNEASGVQLAVTADTSSGETSAKADAGGGNRGE